MLFLLLSGAMEKAGIAPWGLGPIYLVFPVQTVVCAGALAWYWPVYRLRMPRKPWLAAGIGLLVFALWVAPQVVFHRADRVAGFDPGALAGHAGLYGGEVALRFLRLVLVAPLIEEIFWRGFLLRYLIDEDFDAVPFGTYGPWANAVVAAGFMFEHAMPDWPAALAAGLLYNLAACRTRSLSSCALAHGITNALLGGYIMITRQWGFW